MRSLGNSTFSKLSLIKEGATQHWCQIYSAYSTPMQENKWLKLPQMSN
jgi:hypothetical protein